MLSYLLYFVRNLYLFFFNVLYSDGRWSLAQGSHIVDVLHCKTPYKYYKFIKIILLFWFSSSSSIQDSSLLSSLSANQQSSFSFLYLQLEIGVLHPGHELDYNIHPLRHPSQQLCPQTNLGNKRCRLSNSQQVPHSFSSSSLALEILSLFLFLLLQMAFISPKSTWSNSDLKIVCGLCKTFFSSSAAGCGI